MEIDKEEVDTEDPKCENIPNGATRRCRCAELEEITRKAEGKIAELESEIEKRKNEFEELETKFKKLEDERSAMECEILSLFTRNGDIKRQLDRMENKIKADAAVDLAEDEDRLFCLMVENKTLECEKKKAESDTELWKGMVESLVLKMDDVAGPGNLEQWLNELVKGSDDAEYLRAILGKLKRGAQAVNLADAAANCNTRGTPYNDTPCKQAAPLMSGTRGICSESKKNGDIQTRKRLSFDNKRIPGNIMAPSTPGVAKTSSNVINICDSDDEDEISDSQATASNDQLIRKIRVSNDSGKEIYCGNFLEESLSDQDYGDDCKDVFCIATPKRKRAANIVTSDTDTDDEDHVPLSKLKRMTIQESCSNSKRSADIQGVMTRSKRRLLTARECEEKVGIKRSCSNQTSGNKNQQGIPTTDDVEDSESEEDESGSEEQSSSSFIDDSVDSGVNDSDDNASTEYEDEVEPNVEFGEILSKLRRSKGNKLNWEYEADMLAAFGKDPELCMKAVCALYRQQTEEEKAIKGTFLSNNRGFSKFDANRGSQLAEFLTDGDPLGDVKKSVQQLQEHYSNGVKLCRTLAKRYSKQLFEIYKQEEDPFFHRIELGRK